VTKLLENKFEQFDKSHREAVEFIKEALVEDDDWKDVRGIVKWMLETDANPYSYLQEPWSEKTTRAEDFVDLIHYIRHALYNDGCCTIVAVNKEPRIIFHYGFTNDFKALALSNIEKKMEISMAPHRKKFGMTGEQYEIEVLDIKLNDFGQHYDAYFENQIKEWFSREVKYGSVETAIKHYSNYQLFKPEWVKECRKREIKQ